MPDEDEFQGYLVQIFFFFINNLNSEKLEIQTIQLNKMRLKEFGCKIVP